MSAKDKFLSVLRVTALFPLLLLGLPAQAADYILSDDSNHLPPGCAIVSPGNYSCGVLTLGSGDTIEPEGTKPATVTFNGAFTTGASNRINADGLASDLYLVTVGALTLAADAIVNANVTVTGAVILGAGSTLGGDISTDTGIVTVGNSSSIGGGITTGAGSITIGDGSSTCGSVISTGAGVITLTTNVKIGGSIRSVAGAITVGAGSTVGGDIIPSGAGVVTLTSVHVGGNVNTDAGAITLTNSRVGGSVASFGGGVVTLTNSTVNDLNLVVPPSPACPSQTDATVTLSNQTQTYTGNPITPTAMTSPEGLTVDLTYDGSATAPTETGSYVVIAKINDANYSGSATYTLVIENAIANLIVVAEEARSIRDSTASYQNLVNSGILNLTSNITINLSGMATNDGVLRLYGDSVINVAGTFTNTGVIDIINWNGTLPTGLVNFGTILDSSDIQVISVSVSPTECNLSTPSYAGHSYQLQTSNNLGSAWQALGPPIEGTGSVSDPATIDFCPYLDGPNRYYRVVVTPSP